MQTYIENLMELIDDASIHLPSSIYMEMCSTIKKAYDALPKNQQVYQTADTIVPIPPPGAVIPQPDLMTFVPFPIPPPTFVPIAPIPPPGAVIPEHSPLVWRPTRPTYISVPPNSNATKATLKSGTYKGDIIIMNNQYYKVVRKNENYIAIALATRTAPHEFSYSIRNTLKAYCTDTTQFTIAFHRNRS
jgi:hypothetical protein